MTPAVTVVVPTRDRPSHLAACTAALRAELRPGDRLLVVDSCSRTPVPGALRADRPGASLARNLGWQAATTELVAFVDDDVTVAPGWRAAVDPAFEGVDLVCGQVRVPPAQAGAERPVAVTPDVGETLLDADSPEVLGVSANLLVRRAVLEARGGFDERLGPGTWWRSAEDLELLDRLLAAGHRGRYAPAVLAHHDQWRSRRELLRTDYGYGRGAAARAALAGGERGRRLRRQALWDDGLAPVPGDLRRRYAFGVATGLVRTAGTVSGLRRARLLR